MTDLAAETTDRPPKKKKKKWHGATWIALASAATAIVAAGISFHQVNLAAEQNTVAEQEQLVTLTITITNQFAQTQPSATSSSAQSSASSSANLAQVTGEANAEQGVVAALSADGQAAAVLINSLHGNGVAGIEYVQVARALEAGGEVDPAITFYKDAVTVSPPGDAETRGDALRYLAALYYLLGRNAIGHQDMMKAARIFSGHVVLTRLLIEESIAEAYLGDAYFQLLIDGCHVALTDVQDALHAVQALPKSTTADPTLLALADEDAAAAHAKCLA
jgi:tetratricopeptide (TPR) repeat protein